MKRILSVLVVLTVFACTWAVAQGRNVYGYVFGLGTATGAISEIRIHDTTTGFMHWADGWGWHPLAPGGLRWFKNNLTTGRNYTVYVVSNGLGTKTTSFYLASGGGDFKAANITFP